MNEIRFEGKALTINGKAVTFPCMILSAFIVEGIVIVTLDGSSKEVEEKFFRNILGFDLKGNLVWLVEPPPGTRNTISNAYSIPNKSNPLRVNTYASYDCTIDPLTGKILSKIFYK